MPPGTGPGRRTARAGVGHRRGGTRLELGLGLCLELAEVHADGLVEPVAAAGRHRDHRQAPQPLHDLAALLVDGLGAPARAARGPLVQTLVVHAASLAHCWAASAPVT